MDSVGLAQLDTWDRKERKGMDIFLRIMNLIEQNTDIPMLEKDIEEWLKKNKKNQKVLEIYKLASKARDLED